MADQNGKIHRQVVELLSAYYDGELEAEERALVEAHLGSCRDCAEDFASLRYTADLLRQLPSVAIPRPFTLRAADVEPQPATRLGWWSLRWLQLGLTTALVLCVVTAAGAIWLGGGHLLGRMQATPIRLALQAPPAAEEKAERAPAATMAPPQLGAAPPAPSKEEAERPPPPEPAQPESLAEEPVAPPSPSPPAMVSVEETEKRAATEQEAANGMADRTALPSPTAKPTPPAPEPAESAPSVAATGLAEEPPAPSPPVTASLSPLPTPTAPPPAATASATPLAAAVGTTAAPTSAPPPTAERAPAPTGQPPGARPIRLPPVLLTAGLAGVCLLGLVTAGVLVIYAMSRRGH